MITFTHSLTPLPFLKGGLNLLKIPQKGGIEKLLKGRGDHQKGGILCERGNAVSLDIFSSWGVANVTTVTFNYILVTIFLFPLNVGVSPCFHCFRLHTSCLHDAGFLVLVWTCGFNLFLKCVIIQELMRFHTYVLTCGQAIMICFYMMGLGANFTMREIASSANS